MKLGYVRFDSDHYGDIEVTREYPVRDTELGVTSWGKQVESGLSVSKTLEFILHGVRVSSLYMSGGSLL